MPSSTSLLDAEEPELPPPLLHTFASVGLEELPPPRFGVLGAVLDLQPLAAELQEDEEAPGVEEDDEEGDGKSRSAAEAQHLPQPGMILLPAAGFCEPETAALLRRRSVNTTECVEVPSSEHVAEIVGRQGCKIKALRAKTNTYIKTPVRGEQPVFVVTGRKEDVAMARLEILSAADHFSLIRASRNKVGGSLGGAVSGLMGAPTLPGQTTIQVRVPYRVVGLVVGPKGATIKRIQQQTHTYIVTPSRDKEPVFEVTGMPENVDRAREEIEAHIALRTGGYVELPGDEDDFHCNGTDVSFDLMQSSSSSSANNGSYRNGSSSSLGSGSSDSFYNRLSDLSPTSPFSGGFWFADTLFPEQEPPGLDALTVALSNQVLWSPFEAGVSLPGTPRLSPTFPDGSDAPVLSRQVRSDPVSMLPPANNSTAGTRCGFLPTPTSSSSGDSTASGSPPECRGRPDCVQCLEGESVAALVPCGHNLFCMKCASHICHADEPCCPICQAPVTQALRLRNI